MKAKEKLAYLKGLAEGYGIMEDKKEKKLLSMAFELVEELADEIECLGERLEVQELFVEELRDALADLEDEFYDEYEDDDYFDFDDFDDFCRRGGGYYDDDDDDDDDYYDEDDDDDDCDDEFGDIFDISCPNCEETFAVDEGVVDIGVISCPFCGERLEIEGIIDEEEEDSGCDTEGRRRSYPADYENMPGGCSPSACSSCGSSCGGYEEEDEEEEDED